VVSLSVCLSVGWSVCHNCEPGVRWGPDPPMQRGNFEGEKGQPRVKHSDSGMSWAKVAELIEMPCGMWTGMGARKACVRWGSTLASRDEHD